DQDVTRIIAKPSITTSDHDTKIISKPISEVDEDATRIITKPVSSATDNDTKIISIPSSEVDEDATRIIAKPVNTATDDDTKIISKSSSEVNEDATRIIAKPVNTATDDDTKLVIAKPGDTIQVKDDTIDQTIIIASVNKETKSPASTFANASFSSADEEKKPDIVVRRREKPVVLFNRYEYLPATDLIGKGGFSRVYKSYDKKLSRWVALKIYKTGEFSDRYSPIAEIKRVVNLDHPNICRYLDIEEIENENPFGENEKIQVCVMELLDSGNFAEYYKANKNPDILKKLVQDILNGLSYLHKNGIIHRDIKPGNILIKQTIEGPVAKITDFGISKNSDTENNSSSALIVSIPYMAPEQLNAKKYGINDNISFNLDLWSLGVTIYEVVTGKALFKNTDQDNSEQIMANIMAPELPEKLNDLPEPFKTIISHCVIKNARERASRAEELMVLLHTASMPANTVAVLASQAANTTADAEKEAIIAMHTEPVIIEKGSATIPNTSAKSSFPFEDEEEKPVTIKETAEVPNTSAKSRFSFGDEVEKPVPLKDKKKINTLALFIGAAVLGFIVFVIYIKTGNQPPPFVSNNSGTQKKISTHKAVSIIPAPDTLKKNTESTDKTDSLTNTGAIDKPVSTTAKKKEKPVAETHKKEPATTEKATSNTAAKYVLILSSEQACTLKINSIDYGDLQNGKPLRIYLVTGKYILQFTSSTNSASTYTANIEVKPENLGHASKFNVPLK
ncbi:MAG TPA: serine/threonine-protein kinase, partial [Chitinophagaceae bacterium]|nr:serine/threonine-protein kinase [Chitinophagaceae bacterium]